jgi:hypothetical protein
MLANNYQSGVPRRSRQSPARARPNWVHLEDNGIPTTIELPAESSVVTSTSDSAHSGCEN